MIVIQTIEWHFCCDEMNDNCVVLKMLMLKNKKCENK